MGVTRSLVKLAVGTGCVLCGLACSPILADAGIVWGPILASFLGNVAAGNTATSRQPLPLHPSSRSRTLRQPRNSKRVKLWEQN